MIHDEPKTGRKKNTRVTFDDMANSSLDGCVARVRETGVSLGELLDRMEKTAEVARATGQEWESAHTIRIMLATAVVRLAAAPIPAEETDR
ncbi:MAG: hypothetical protein ACLP9Y_27865 [Mycobacterium sp.]